MQRYSTSSALCLLSKRRVACLGPVGNTAGGEESRSEKKAIPLKVMEIRRGWNVCSKFLLPDFSPCTEKIRLVCTERKELENCVLLWGLLGSETICFQSMRLGKGWGIRIWYNSYLPGLKWNTMSIFLHQLSHSQAKPDKLAWLKVHLGSLIGLPLLQGVFGYYLCSWLRVLQIGHVTPQSWWPLQHAQ